VEGVLAQRLIRTICSECKTAYKPDPADLPNDFPYDSAMRLYKGVGCRACRQTGYRGRTGIHELLVTGDPIRELVVDRVNASRIRQEGIARGMTTLRKDGWRKVLAGQTTVEEIARVTAGDVIM
jgi:general secretion pathway protein E/type IV pilus assembly protein PilB